MSILVALQAPSITGSGASTVQFVDAGVALEIFTGSGASAVKFSDAGSGIEVFTGSGSSRVPFFDAGVGNVLVDITGSGASVVRLVDDGIGQVVNPRVFIDGGGPPPPKSRAKKKRKVVDRPLKWEPWSPEPEAPAYISPERPLPRVQPLPLGPVAPSLDPILAPAAARQRARETEARFHAAQDRTATGHSTIVLISSGVGRVIPPEMLSMLRQLATN